MCQSALSAGTFASVADMRVQGEDYGDIDGSKGGYYHAKRYRLYDKTLKIYISVKMLAILNASKENRMVMNY